MSKRNLFYSALFLATSLTATAETVTWTDGSSTWEVELTTTTICPGVKYTLADWKTTRYSSIPGSRLHVIEADLTNPLISVENVKQASMTGTRSLVNHAKAVHTSSHQVAAGANGNFWITSSEKGNYACMGAQPHGICVSDGVMYTDPNVGNFAHCGGPSAYTGMIAFDEDGKCYIDYTAAQKTNNEVGSGVQFAAINTRIGHRMMLDMCNRYVATSSASIFTRQYDINKTFRVGTLTGDTWTQTKGSDDYIEIILDYASGVTEMNYGGITNYVIKEIRYNPDNFGTLGDHDLAIVGRGAFASVPYQNWIVGDQIQLDTQVNFKSVGSPNKIVNAISGNVLAMKDGVITQGVTTESYNTTYYARTVYGTNADGTKLWIFTCEHNAARANKYYGFKLQQICTIARDYFGVTNATQVDGGGSAQMYVNGKQVSTSTDASGVRSVYNGLFVIYNGDAGTYQPGTETITPSPNPDAGWTDSGERAHYAYDLKNVSNTETPTIQYSLTGNVKSAEVILTNREDDTDLISLYGGTNEGVNTVPINKNLLTDGATYDWEVQVNSFPVSTTSHFFHDAPDKLDARGGVGVVTNPESSAFGKVITSMGYAQGFGLYNPNLTKEGVYHAGSSPWVSTNRSSTYRIAMRDQSVAYACDFSDLGAGYWRFDPENPSVEPTNLIGGVNDGTGCFTLPGSSDCIGSGASGIGFQGSGTSTNLWVFAEDWPTGNSSYKGILARWKIGTANEITTAATSTFDQYSGLKTLTNQNASISCTQKGLFVAQNRATGNNTTSAPAFIYINQAGTLLYNASTDNKMFTSCGGSVAISDDLSLFAISGNKENIKVYNVSWSSNTPTFTLLATVYGTSHCEEVSQLAFDPAGNLYAWQRNTDAQYAGLFGYSYQNDNPTATTPAKAEYAVSTNDVNGISAISVDDNTTAVYYNLQGLQVNADKLTPGIYIKVSGTRTQKIIIK